MARSSGRRYAARGQFRNPPGRDPAHVLSFTNTTAHSSSSIGNPRHQFVTRGRTLLAAAAVLYQALPCVEIRAFALVRTEGLAPDIAAITAPTIGTIRYLGGDAFRSP
jgi:O-antigen ligase